MKLLVTGGTGFIGRPLCDHLLRQGHEIIVLTRQPASVSEPGARAVSWEGVEWQRILGEVDGVINLAGESLATKRWSPSRKRAISDSRVQTTRALVEAMAGQAHKPSVLINASAIGYYGPRQDEACTELTPPGSGFLAELCRRWEAEARRAEPLGVRVVRLRIGLVLGRGGGALAKMVPPFRGFVGGWLGTGRQWVSWIHRDDVLGLIAWTLTQQGVAGAINATAPEPATMRQLCDALGRVLHRPSWAPVPAFALRLVLGEMADLLLSGQRALPEVALRMGYPFQYPDLSPALASCLGAR